MEKIEVRVRVTLAKQVCACGSCKSYRENPHRWLYMNHAGAREDPPEHGKIFETIYETKEEWRDIASIMEASSTG